MKPHELAKFRHEGFVNLWTFMDIVKDGKEPAYRTRAIQILRKKFDGLNYDQTEVPQFFLIKLNATLNTHVGWYFYW